jgi:hypothetical protein
MDAARVATMKELHLFGDSISDASIKALGHAENLHSLTIEHGLLPASIEPLSSSPHLTSLTLKEDDARDSVATQIAHLHALTKLSLEGNRRFDDKGTSALTGLDNLRSLSLARTSISDDSILSLLKMKGLKELDLTNTKVSAYGVLDLIMLLPDCAITVDKLSLEGKRSFGDRRTSELTKLANLHSLSLAGTRISDASVPYLKQLKGLKELDLTNTRISGSAVLDLMNALPDCIIKSDTDADYYRGDTTSNGRQFDYQLQGDRVSYLTGEADSLPLITNDALSLAHSRQPKYKITDQEISDAAKAIALANHIGDKAPLLPWTRLTIPPAIIRDRKSPTTPPVPVKGSSLLFSQGASPAFAERVASYIATLPESVLSLVKNSGCKFIVGGAVADVDPYARYKVSPGMRGMHDDEVVGGRFDPEKRTIYIFESVAGQPVDAEETERVVAHEVGHAIDFAIGYFSRSPDFRWPAYLADFQAMSENARSRESYNLQRGDTGPGEAMADAFADVTGHIHGQRHVQMVQDFPKVLIAVRQRLAQLDGYYVLARVK